MLTVRISVNLVAREFLNNNEDIRHISIRQRVKSIKFKEQVKVKF